MSRSHVALAVAIGVFASQPALAQDDDPISLDDIPHVTMVGHARTSVAPDLATLTLGVDVERPSAREAAAEAARIAAALVDAAKASGIARADIRTQAITLTQTYDDVRDAQGGITGRKPRGFEAGERLAIQVRDLGKAGPLAQTLIEKGANRFEGIGFSVEHPQPVIAKLTADAVRDAQAQATQAAEASGSKLGRILKIEPQGESNARPLPSFRFAAGATVGAPPVEAGMSEIEVATEVTWALDRP